MNYLAHPIQLTVLKNHFHLGASLIKRRLILQLPHFTVMVIPPPVRAQRITNYLKPYLLKMHFSNKFVSAQVIHTPTATVASSASSQEKALREAWISAQQSTRDVAAAAKIGKLLGERLLQKDIPAVSVVYKKEQRYHGKVKAVIDSLREAGVKLL
ncbi:Ribosomal protein L18/L5 [Artemisia annua]|uniref:Ribosomal protein L18/L5 n=2 Tax=Artemisia annua TaxID=35608 RepID=A0A2U1NPZ0_ARTAN|nr:Ribosomal protein L18/L5 [Artemisia annua]